MAPTPPLPAAGSGAGPPSSSNRRRNIPVASPPRKGGRRCRKRRPTARRPSSSNKPPVISILDDEDDENKSLGDVAGPESLDQPKTQAKMRTRSEAKSLRSSRESVLYLYSLARCKPSKGLRSGRRANSRDDAMLDTMKFESYIEHLWSLLPEEKRSSYIYLDSLWFSMYTDGASKPKVLTWIKNKHIFLKNYVFVPIVLWKHWSLLIFCNLQSENPCMLLLDSLQSTGPKRLEPNIRKFLLDIYKSEGKLVTKKFISNIPLLVPKVPQQTNDNQCGAFVLYFIKLFIQSAPEYFTTEEYPYFLDERWFTVQDLEQFQEGIA